MCKINLRIKYKKEETIKIRKEHKQNKRRKMISSKVGAILLSKFFHSTFLNEESRSDQNGNRKR